MKESLIEQMKATQEFKSALPTHRVRLRARTGRTLVHALRETARFVDSRDESEIEGAKAYNPGSCDMTHPLGGESADR